ncbi:MAG: tyrosine-type recombinase/integrase [Lachnospiraceae bacterium]|nr:tyrosine-type recombinase/integrase [Lachnospiraceae bacterium]
MPFCKRTACRNAQLPIWRGIDKSKLHGLRKTSATNMIMQGMDVKSADNRLEHKNCGVTLKIYTVVTNEMKVKNAGKMEEVYVKTANG